jgi:Cu-Zn family superoxide dismutase
MAGALVAVSLATACSVAVAAAGEKPDLVAEGTLAPADRGSGAVTYNPGIAPEGAKVTVTVTGDGDGGTVIALDVDGFLPDRGYAAHAHVNPCGSTGADAGPHFQNTPDPAAAPDRPSTDPAYANPENEVWLDLHTDADRGGRSEARVPFAFAESRAPRSVVIHEADKTATHAGHAGTAGARAACLTLATS